MEQKIYAQDKSTVKRKIKWFLLACCILSALLLFCHMQNTTLTVTEYSFQNEKIPIAFDGFRIVQISDLHNTSFGKDNKRLIDKIEQLSPDMIALTGDLVDSRRTNIDISLSFVEQASLIAPVYYVTGNHEERLETVIFEELMSGLEHAGAVILEDESLLLEAEGEYITLLGLKDESLQSNALHKLTDAADPTQFQLLLAHEPQYLDAYYSECHVDLILSGHAHGGQFRFPFIGGIYAPDQGLFPKYTEGMHQSGSSSLIISRGIGNSLFPLRLFNLPEIVCIDLEAQ